MFLSLSIVLHTNSAYDDEISTPGHEVLYADVSEIPTIDLMVQGITRLPQFSDLQGWLQSESVIARLQRFASFVAHEETVLVNYSTEVNDSTKSSSGLGGTLEHKVLCVSKRSFVRPPSRMGQWTEYLSQSPGFR
jgi:hypothetical protein